MTKELSNCKPLVFEHIKEVDEKGNEFWGARKLSKILEYSEFRHFLPVVERAKEACKNSGHQVDDHFEDYLEEIIHGKGAKQDYPSIKLSRNACYLIVQNADQNKVNVKNRFDYFNTCITEDNFESGELNKYSVVRKIRITESACLTDKEKVKEKLEL